MKISTFNLDCNGISPTTLEVEPAGIGEFTKKKVKHLGLAL
jgi:hypothetical protein